MGGIVGRLFREFAVTLSVAIAISLVVSLTTTPMMCARLSASRRDAAARPAVHARASACSTRILARLRRTLGWVLRHRAHAARSLLATIALNVLPVRRSSRRASSRSRTPAGSPADPGRPGHLVPGDAAKLARRSSSIVQRGSGGRDVVALHRRRRRREHRRMFVALEAAASAALSADQVIARLRGKLAHDAGRQRSSCRRCRTSASAAGRATRSTSTRCRRRLAELDDVGAAPAARAAHSCRARRRQQRPAEPRAADVARRSTATRPRGSASRRADRSTTRCTTRSASGRCRRCTRRSTSTTS